MKRFLSLLLAFVVCLGLWACNDTPPTPSPVPPESLSLAGEDISKYTVIYAPSYAEEDVAAYGNYFGYDYEYNGDAAHRIANTLNDIFGVTLPVKTDDAPVGEYEILVGDTNRTESAGVADLRDNEYTIRVSGKKLIIAGGSSVAIQAMTTAVRSAILATTVADIAWDSATDHSGTCAIRRIACVGDSITMGSKSSTHNDDIALNRDLLSYPANLQRILYDSYAVYNYGLGGQTMRNDTEKPYQACSLYQDCLNSGYSYDLIFVMLGTNDSRQVKDADGASKTAWDDADVGKYIADFEILLSSLKEKSPNAKFVMMNCPESYVANYGQHFMHAVQKTAAEAMKAKGYDIVLYDMYQFTVDNMTKNTHYADGLHPNDKGYAIMAEELATLVPVVLDGGTNGYLIPLG